MDVAEAGGGVSGDKKVCAGPTPVPLSTLHAELKPLDSLRERKKKKKRDRIECECENRRIKFITLYTRTGVDRDVFSSSCRERSRL